MFGRKLRNNIKAGINKQSGKTGDRICGLVVRVLGYRSGGPGSIPGTTRFSEKKKKEKK
jgi:hypothetical protein